ncbi:MAG TPA: hypothetical protein VJB59_04300 [Bdellovibrionota bacterium]|nr:hypothetical protein [Bdellovibrionota bacterium]
MKSTLGLCLLLCVVCLSGGNRLCIADSATQDLFLSDTFRLGMSQKLKAKQAYLPSQGAYQMEGTYSGKPYRVWIQRTIPETIANPVSVKRVWAENLSILRSMGQKLDDHGCKEEKDHLFRCHSTSRFKNEYSESYFFWNGKADLAVVRVTSVASLDFVSNLISTFSFNFKSRSLAGGKK